jgi:hypothetical protein
MSAITSSVFSHKDVRRTIFAFAFTDEIDVGGGFICQQMLLKIVRERRPIVRETILLEILQRERKTVVNAYQRGDRLRETFDEPMRNRLACPVFSWTGSWSNFARLTGAIRYLHAQPIKAGLTRLGAGVVDPNVSLKCRAHIFARNGETSFLSCEDYHTKGFLRPKRRWMGRETIAHKYGTM